MRQKQSVIAAVAVLLAIAACTPPAERPGARATISSDEFRSYVEIDSPMMFEDLDGGISDYYELSTNVDKVTHAYVHVLSVLVGYSKAPIHFQFAADDTSRELELAPSGEPRRACRDCGREESFDIVISDAALRAHAASGYRIKVWAAGGQSIILTISPAMIAAQFAGLDEYLATGAVAAP